MPGLIPASAGSTRGEITGTHTFEGSSPRLRGAPVDTTSVCLVGGLIPASAGSTPGRAHHRDLDQAHPRVCGEHAIASVIGTRTAGSSPRLRGARNPLRNRNCPARLIPASAGSTRSRIPDQRQQRAHPRVCGEHATTTHRRGNGRGSSPRLRGAPERSF